MKTFTGLNKETECACGCKARMPANPAIQVVVDMDSRPWKRYIPGHEPQSSRGDYRGKAKRTQDEKSVSAPSPAPPAPAGPAPQGPSPTTPQPQVDPSPIPHPKAETTNAPSLSDNRPWKILKVTISVGDYTSVQAGVADFGKEGESLEQLGTRLVSELTKDVKTELEVVHNVQAGKPLFMPALGVVSTPSTLSAPSGAAPAKGVVGPEMAETRRQINVELECDVSAIRSVKKRHAAKHWLKAHGYETFEQVLPRDLGALKGLLAQFEAINNGADAIHPSLSGPAFQTASGLAASSK